MKYVVFIFFNFYKKIFNIFYMKDNYKIVDIINNGAIVTVYKIKKKVHDTML